MRERELPLTALRAFAIAARSPSLAVAARQLGVTHGAVSKQIAVLETWLGQTLFVRQGRTLELTPYGRILADRINQSLQHMWEACEYVRRDRSRRVISIEAPATFAMYFLLPRIKDFEDLHTNLSVWISTRMTGQTADPKRHDVVISRGQLPQVMQRAGATQHLFQEKLTAVGASSLLRKVPVRSPDDIRKHTQIASSSRPGDWEAWFERAGLGSPVIYGGHRFDHLHVALHAVRDGLGLTIAPRLFFGRSNQPYRLRCPLPDIFFPGESYYAYLSQGRAAGDTELFLAWLEGQLGTSELSP